MKKTFFNKDELNNNAESVITVSVNK